MYKNVTDQQLINRVKRGEKAAFDLLVLKYQQRIVNLVSHFIKNHSDALDITQEAFIKAYRALKNFRGDSSFYTWIYRIAINTAKNHLALQSRKPHSINQDISEIEQIEDNKVLRESSTPENFLLRDELQAVIISTIETLPDDLKTAITLREVEGLSYEEISTVMNCPIGTVRSRIFRAREAIDKQISPLLKD